MSAPEQEQEEFALLVQQVLLERFEALRMPAQAGVPRKPTRSMTNQLEDRGYSEVYSTTPDGTLVLHALSPSGTRLHVVVRQEEGSDG